MNNPLKYIKYFLLLVLVLFVFARVYTYIEYRKINQTKLSMLFKSRIVDEKQGMS